MILNFEKVCEFPEMRDFVVLKGESPNLYFVTGLSNLASQCRNASLPLTNIPRLPCPTVEILSNQPPLLLVPQRWLHPLNLKQTLL